MSDLFRVAMETLCSWTLHSSETLWLINVTKDNMQRYEMSYCINQNFRIHLWCDVIDGIKSIIKII